MGFEDGDIEGVVIRKLLVHSDGRGTLVETYRIDTAPEGIKPVMSYVSYTEPGIGRGPHEHLKQTDMFAFIGPGDFELYLCDNRKKSATYKNRLREVVGEKNPVLVVVPPGVVHGYRNMSKSDRGMVVNYPDKLYRGWGGVEEVDEVRHEDKGDEFYEDFVSKNTL
ncbi:MAG: dTDP-4-dehydrorhamnose 3,5-epimerase family protein [Spirochaetes bacterium]|nr:dTDP-4-dehydrorhamnose 3,5-epimerase family protein [Spirochaetota bacterium]